MRDSHSSDLPEVRSLFRADTHAAGETIDILASGGTFRLEHIVSRGAASPDGFWYDQPNAEWVALVRGTAILAFRASSIALQAGDCLLIPPHLEHRVEATSLDAVWIAAHFATDTAGASA